MKWIPDRFVGLSILEMGMTIRVKDMCEIKVFQERRLKVVNFFFIRSKINFIRYHLKERAKYSFFNHLFV